MRLLDVIRDTPPEYPWDLSARSQLRATIDLRWRAYCLTQAYAGLLDAAAGAIGPFSSRKDRRESCIVNLRRSGDYVNMAVKRWSA